MKTSFVVGRAVMALVLMIGFYLLAAGIAFGLLWIPYAEVVYAHHVTAKLDIICIIAGLAILWSVLPRPDKFHAPGPQLKREKYPRLFAELEAVAKATNQAMPAEVYLVPDVNAWVAQRGGIMGFGSRRVMGLGLPLMRILTCSQFRAVLAHEFGHYHGGDTKIGPWIYKTRGAIGRTLHSLGNGSWLQKPFLWYGKVFLRITHAVSRRQEFVADELAARTVGAKPLAEGLKSIHKVAPAFDYYWRSECAPVLNAGFLPPVVDGFAQFSSTGTIAEKMDKHLAEQLAEGKGDPYDTHPPLKERIAAVAHLPTGPDSTEDLPAVSLLEDVPMLEKEWMSLIAGAENAAKLKPIDWAEVGSTVYVPQWTKLVQLNSTVLQGITPEKLPKLAADTIELGKKMVDFQNEKPEESNAEGLANFVVGSALVLLLIQRGGKLDATPGNEISVTLNDHHVKPFSLMATLKSGAITPETWLAECAALNIATIGLGPAMSVL